MTRSSRRRSSGTAGGKTRAAIGVGVALAGGALLALAAAQWLEGVFAQALARNAPIQTAARSAKPLPPLPLKSLPPVPDLPEVPEVPATAPEAGDLVGRIRIPRVGIDLAVFEGVSSDILRKGPGHVPGTALPTAGSNCVITAHRDSFFRPLAKVKVGDAVFLTGDGGEREYRLVSCRVASPREVGVLAPTDDEQVTLVTCYPFRWIGPAPYRVVWQALPVAAFAQRAEGPPAVTSR